MLGFFSGVVLAVYYRKEGPQRPVYEWMDEEEEMSSEAEDSEDEGERLGEEEKALNPDPPGGTRSGLLPKIKPGFKQSDIKQK